MTCQGRLGGRTEVIGRRRRSGCGVRRAGASVFLRAGPRAGFVSTSVPVLPASVHRRLVPRASRAPPRRSSTSRRCVDDDVTTAHGDRGVRRGTAARYLVEQGMVVLDRNWRCEQGEIDLVLRDGEVLVFCEVKTRASAAFGGTARGGDPDEGRPAAPARPPAGCRSAGSASATCGSTWSGCCSTVAATAGSSTSAGWADGASRRPGPSSLDGVTGHVIDVQADVVAGAGDAPRWSAARTLGQRGARPVPGGDRSTAATSGPRPSG